MEEQANDKAGGRHLHKFETRKPERRQIPAAAPPASEAPWILTRYAALSLHGLERENKKLQPTYNPTERASKRSTSRKHMVRHRGRVHSTHPSAERATKQKGAAFGFSGTHKCGRRRTTAIRTKSSRVSPDRRVARDAVVGCSRVSTVRIVSPSIRAAALSQGHTTVEDSALRNAPQRSFRRKVESGDIEGRVEDVESSTERHAGPTEDRARGGRGAGGGCWELNKYGDSQDGPRMKDGRVLRRVQNPRCNQAHGAGMAGARRRDRRGDEHDSGAMVEKSKRRMDARGRKGWMELEA
ncbi:hypothetical protein DFP72DRAFT_1042402 [Ephemerocybe angulata]|uniref:Uncharacterized protein n=1 Tax=Ephemerocybe angulata TaxID=980116 RepID=A0A8H6I8K6_9AGAR|nr:hypothetical protein DFP72DRAFT_1042402 [Tulosesus angulatus]